MRKTFQVFLLLLLCLAWAVFVYAQEGGAEEGTGAEGIVLLGKYAAAPLLMLFLSFVFNIFGVVSNRVKQCMAMVCGLLLALAALYLTDEPMTKTVVAEYLIEGFYLGLTTIGMHQIRSNFKSATNSV